MPDKNPPTPKKSMLYNAIIVLVVILLLQAFIVPLVNQSQVTDVTYDQFIAMLDAAVRRLKRRIWAMETYTSLLPGK